MNDSKISLNFVGSEIVSKIILYKQINPNTALKINQTKELSREKKYPLIM